MGVVTGAQLFLPKVLGSWSSQGLLQVIVTGDTHVAFTLSQGLFQVQYVAVL